MISAEPRPRSGYRLLLVALVVLGIWIAAWATGLTGHFTSESVRSLLAGRGLWGFVAFTVVFSVGQLLRIPSLVFVAAAVAVYGGNSGALVALFGALVSAIVSFAVVRAFAGQPLADVQRRPSGGVIISLGPCWAFLCR